MTNLTSLEKKLDIKFKNKKLLQQALIHRSYLNEHPECQLEQNERLEFLGDAILEFVTTEYLYRDFKNPEGEMTSWRASLVNTENLSKLAQKIKLNQYLYLSRGESQSLGKARKIILANTIEALIGAIYLDQGIKATKKFIGKKILSQLPKILEKKLYKDPKSKLQEIAQAKFKITPVYRVLHEEGPAHQKKFTVGLFINENLIAKATGMSKFEAEVRAAKKGLTSLEI